MYYIDYVNIQKCNWSIYHVYLKGRLYIYNNRIFAATSHQLQIQVLSVCFFVFSCQICLRPNFQQSTYIQRLANRIYIDYLPSHLDIIILQCAILLLAHRTAATLCIKQQTVYRGILFIHCYIIFIICLHVYIWNRNTTIFLM